MNLPNQLHQTIAAQIDHVLPEGLVPGKDVGMEVIDRTTLRILAYARDPERRCAWDVRYDEGWDTYVLTRYVPGGPAEEPISDVYCDQLGDLIFGDEAKPFTMPMVQISHDDGETWDVIA